MWTPAALASEARSYKHDLWRLVENQARASTIRLVGTLADQVLLEDMLEETKPPMPPECDGLHFLLATPFRYSPYPHGSRFRRMHQAEGVYYAAERPETAAAEAAHYALLFFLESPGTQLPARPMERTGIEVPCAVERAIDLTAPPLDRDQALWTDKANYAACQDLADATRQAGAQLIRYQSVRDPLAGANVALLTPRGFGAKRPKRLSSWHLFIRPQAVQVWCEFPVIKLEFPR
ncbi:RES family NAD+ phosphorylase [Nitrospirillum sp. BR 11164]|uniref:RES family NAD+ phosphorylase n=1 Tax=Nitrospirillum sp. BR 11164 TaxID=3104324 RepID=UPI002AFE99EC|nr:RES family NAD+ phosphorylase [Nitrospirillum sp. BR 11164]MEA1649461.1 RES family NAD+ phosphorylase [Nitrospirillum sp. BR 11164]